MANFKNDFEDPGYDEPDCSEREDCCGNCHNCDSRYQAMVDNAEERIELMEMREE